MKKILILILLMILSFVTFSSLTFALFSFVNDSTYRDNVAVDPVFENYDCSNSDYGASSTFNVYFFPQPRYALGLTYGDTTNASNPNAGCKFDQAYTNNLHNNLKPVGREDILGYYYGKKLDYANPTGPLTKYTLDDPGTLVNRHKYNEGSNRRSVRGRFKESDGYFTQQTGKARYEPKHIVSDSTLGTKVFQQVEKPGLKMKDDHGWYGNGYSFCGWTPSQLIAADLGYGGTGDFGLIEPNSPLLMIDRIPYDQPTKVVNGKVVNNVLEGQEFLDAKHKKMKALDGTYIGDRDVFLYPIFSLGKDYSNTTTMIDCINVTDAANNNNIIGLYSPLVEPKSGARTYCGRAITMNKTSLKIKFQPSDGSSITGAPYWSANDINGNSKFQVVKTSNPNRKQKTLTTYPIIDRAGFYNIYFYVYSDTGNSKTYANIPKTASGVVDTNYIPVELKDRNLVDILYFEDNSELPLACFVYVEETYQYKVIGGNMLSFDFHNANVDACNPVGTLGINYAAENVFFNEVDNGYFSYVSYAGKGHIFKNSVFTVLPISTNPNKSLSNEYKVQINPSSTTLAVADPTDYKIDSTDTEFYNALNGKLFKVKKDGFYRIKCVIKDKIITLDAEEIKYQVFVTIYENKSDIKYVNNDPNNFIDLRASTGNAKGKVYINDRTRPVGALTQTGGLPDTVKGLEALMYGAVLNNGIHFAEYTASTNKFNPTNPTLQQILDAHPGKMLYDAATDLPYGFGDTPQHLDITKIKLFKNKVFYLK